MNINLTNRKKFAKRHIGVSDSQLQNLLSTIGVQSLEQLMDETVPDTIRNNAELNLPQEKSEYVFLNEFRQLAAKNKIFKSFIGLGYYDCITPNVITRNILENPGWYTAYTPYQAEIAQGRLEMLLSFQTLVTDLTGMYIANASLLDEATAAAEMMNMFYNARKGSRKNAYSFFVSDKCFPQTIDVLKTRAIPLGINLVIDKLENFDASNLDLFGLLIQYPDLHGEVKNYSDLVDKAHAQDILVGFAADLLSLSIFTPPGEMGADAVVGTTQRFGVPMGCGGPHAGYMATKEEFKRIIPGRIIGVSVDATGKQAYRMALQTREQHIRREKATSNICTAQVLLAVIAAAYAVYHGPEGIRGIGTRVHGMAKLLATALKERGFPVLSQIYFDTIRIEVGNKLASIRSQAEFAGMNFWYDNEVIQISVDETTEVSDIESILTVFGVDSNLDQLLDSVKLEFSNGLERTSAYLEHPVFNSYHSEHEMLRYLKHLENKDLSLVHSMISLGSCTMKLNATSEMLAITWPEFARIHPFAPKKQLEGYTQLFSELSLWLSEITGFADVSLQPNSGAQGEYAGLLVIRKYLESIGQGHRNIALIPSSAHGTNPASAVMVGYKVVVVKCDENGNIDISDLKDKAEKYKNELAALLITYPSTHGVFEEGVKEICALIHNAGGQVYMDGANMNAQVGLTSPGFIGADVCHLNLHKTFCIPHGGGGPGMGPIGVAKHLVQFLPNHSVVSVSDNEGISAVSAAPYGSASILPISYAYISMMGAKGLKDATRYAILNANYLKARLESHYPVLYSGKNNRCAHEFILDCRNFKNSAGIEVEDIAKRLMDYGFHAPTVSFPVPGTLMVEPTESESQVELDRFCEAMISIRKEIQEIEDGIADKEKNVLKMSPHAAEVIMDDKWDRPYSREKAAFPLAWVKVYKFWPAVSRIDSAFGDRNLICTCPPIESYGE
jgi:glycine dehydrogenase